MEYNGRRKVIRQDYITKGAWLHGVERGADNTDKIDAYESQKGVRKIDLVGSLYEELAVETEGLGWARERGQSRRRNQAPLQREPERYRSTYLERSSNTWVQQ